MTHVHKLTGIEFEVGSYMSKSDRSTYDMTIISLWNTPDGSASELMLVDYYFGDYEPELTDKYIDNWLLKIKEDTDKLLLSEKYLQYYLETNRDVLDQTDIDEVCKALTYTREQRTDKQIIAKSFVPVELVQMIKFKEWFDSLLGPEATKESIDKLYDDKITITVAGKSIDLQFDAENYNNVETVLKRAIEEY